MPIRDASKLQRDPSQRILLGPPGLLLAATCLSLLLGMTCALGERGCSIPQSKPLWTETLPAYGERLMGTFHSPVNASFFAVDVENAKIKEKEIARSVDVSRR